MLVLTSYYGPYSSGISHFTATAGCIPNLSLLSSDYDMSSVPSVVTRGTCATLTNGGTAVEDGDKVLILADLECDKNFIASVEIKNTYGEPR